MVRNIFTDLPVVLSRCRYNYMFPIKDWSSYLNIWNSLLSKVSDVIIKSLSGTHTRTVLSYLADTSTAYARKLHMPHWRGGWELLFFFSQDDTCIYTCTMFMIDRNIRPFLNEQNARSLIKKHTRTFCFHDRTSKINR